MIFNSVNLFLISKAKEGPECSLSEAQFSFHGHRNAIKFFLSVPSQVIQKQVGRSTDASYEKVEAMLMLSGGHGYIDFRIGDAANEKTTERKFDEMKGDVSESKQSRNERSHLIVWQVNSPIQ